MSDERTIDDELLHRIGAAFDRDLSTPPAHLRAAAYDAFSWRRADAELAELVFDSANEQLAGVRGATTARRSFRYAAGDAVIRIHLTAATMIVMVEPPLSVVCRLASGESRTETEHRTDELGELVVDAPELPVRVEADLPGGTFVTPWVIG